MPRIPFKLIAILFGLAGLVLTFLILGSASAAGPVPDGLYARFDTSQGRILFRLFYKQAPMTTANFIGLAEGTMEWKDPVTGKTKKALFYNGLVFYQVIPDLMIQAGALEPSGQGGPGYLQDSEIDPALSHNRPGILSLLNEGPYAHGSRFLITLAPAPFLDGRHTIIGEAVQGLEVIRKLDQGDRINSIKIIRIGRPAKRFEIGPLLERIRSRAKVISQEGESAARPGTEKRKTGDCRKNLEELQGESDPLRVPSPDQPESDRVALEYILVTYRGAMTPREYQCYEKEEARKTAEHLSKLARMKGTDFSKTALKYSDATEQRIPILIKGKNVPAGIEPVFRLKEGQVSGPLLSDKGYMVFKRNKLELITVRHILIAYQGAAGSRQIRTKKEAQRMAEEIRHQALSGGDFAALAEKYSDSESAGKGGLLAEIARGTTLPAFDQAAFHLKVDEVSKIIPTPAGFQIIKRIE
jgi:cyclophilin family peptidyl-prolyl cis-trans isomerase